MDGERRRTEVHCFDRGGRLPLNVGQPTCLAWVDRLLLASTCREIRNPPSLEAFIRNGGRPGGRLARRGARVAHKRRGRQAKVLLLPRRMSMDLLQKHPKFESSRNA
jgi:hypothetical protein